MFSFLRATSRLIRIGVTGWDGLHDLVSLDLVVNLEGEEIARSPELELCDTVLFVLLDSDLLSCWQVLLLSSHDLDEFL